MEKFSVLIADDERLAREAVKLELRNFPGAEVVAECKNGRETLNTILERKPDIIFLDIQMPYLDGLEVLEKLTTNYSPMVIIVSAFDTYALKAFDSDAVDYLVKPFSSDRFKKAFLKAGNFLSRTSSKEARNTIQELRKIIGGTVLREAETISIKDGIKTFVLDLHDIAYLEATGNYVSVVSTSRKHLHRETLQSMEVRLPSVFIRIHKSTIVNSTFIIQFDSLLNGDHMITLKTGHKLRLSRNYRLKLQHLML